MPIALALVAGGLATVNPCGFALLPALLSFYVGAEEERLPREARRFRHWSLLHGGGDLLTGSR